MSDGDDTPFGYEPGQDSDQNAIREEGPAGRPGFDPTPYMRQLRGRGGNQDYLDVKWRLLWLRREHPDAEILTEHVRIDEGMAIFKATGYGSETAGDFGDFIEKAETKAIGRALNALGYGAQFSEKGEDESPPPSPDRSQSRPAPPERPAPPRPESAARPVTSVRSPAPAPAPVSASPAPDPVSPATFQAPSRPQPVSPVAPVGDDPIPIRQPDAPAPERPTTQARPGEANLAAPTRPARPATTAGPAGDDDDIDMADMTWTAFWAWARPLGYNKRGDIEQFLGYSIDTLTPAEVRTQVRAARDDG